MLKYGGDNQIHQYRSTENKVCLKSEKAQSSLF